MNNGLPVLLRALMLLAALFLPHAASALDPGRSLTQLHHTAWTIEDGAPPDVWALAQSRDGYLWLGTGAGLFRFDGIRFEPVLPRGGYRLPSNNITALLAAPNGDMWIGFVTGDIARYRDGRLQNFPNALRGNIVYGLAQGPDGVIWAAMRAQDQGGLARLADGRWQIIGAESGLPPGGVTSVLAARSGDIWVTAHKGLYVCRRGQQHFVRVAADLEEFSSLAQGSDGGIWVSGGKAGGPFAVEVGGNRAAGARTRQPSAPESGAGRIVFDRDGAMWGTYLVGGLFRINADDRAGRAEKYGLADGLSSDIARPLLEDREGNIWVGTNLGLDRFRATNIVSAPGLPATSRLGFLVSATGKAGDSAIYAAAGRALYRAYPHLPATRLANLPANATHLLADRAGTLWVGTRAGLGRLNAAGVYTPIAMPPTGTGRIAALMQDRDGSICVAVVQKPVFCNRGGVWQQGPSLPGTPAQMLRDADNRLWLNFADRLAMRDTAGLHSFAGPQGLDIGKIGIIGAGPGALLVGGDFGLARFNGTGFDTIGSDAYPVLTRIAGIVQTPGGDVWINGIQGVVRVAASNLAARAGHPAQRLDYQLFDLADGLPGVAQQDSDTPTAMQNSDGRLWFVTSHGVAWIDPAHLVRNTLPPPVAIRALVSGGREYPPAARLTLPAGTSSLRIDYTALSLSVPERVGFRYRLEGVDDGWVNPDGRRQAFYTKLAPGTYQFRVIASNNDDVWNTRGATLDFTIPPTFIQSRWFVMLLVVIGLIVVWLLYSLRLRQMADRMRARLEERIGERERIARELHDTLLQGFQGLVFRFQAATQQIPAELPARALMDEALDRADEVIAEGRDRVVDLRSTPSQTDISRLFAATAAELLPGDTPGFRITVEGRPRPLHPIVQDEVQRIGREALSNAVQHARAKTIEISILYRRRDFTVHFRDDGVGIDPAILARGGRDKHFGLTGMRERARKIRGEIEIASLPGAGTEITFSMPGSIAYAGSASFRWRRPGKPRSEER